MRSFLFILAFLVSSGVFSTERRHETSWSGALTEIATDADTQEVTPDLTCGEHFTLKKKKRDRATEALTPLVYEPQTPYFAFYSIYTLSAYRFVLSFPYRFDNERGPPCFYPEVQ